MRQKEYTTDSGIAAVYSEPLSDGSTAYIVRVNGVDNPCSIVAAWIKVRDFGTGKAIVDAIEDSQ